MVNVFVTVTAYGVRAVAVASSPACAWGSRGAAV